MGLLLAACEAPPQTCLFVSDCAAGSACVDDPTYTGPVRFCGKGLCGVECRPKCVGTPLSGRAECGAAELCLNEVIHTSFDQVPVCAPASWKKQ